MALVHGQVEKRDFKWKGGLAMKRTLMFLGLLAVVFVFFGGVAFPQTIENELSHHPGLEGCA
jgi:hypothetical protein